MSCDSRDHPVPDRIRRLLACRRDRALPVIQTVYAKKPAKLSGLNSIFWILGECRASIASSKAHFGYNHSIK
jgi:hypothetical protein